MQCLRRCSVVAIAVCLAGAIHAQQGFDDNFFDDPLQNDWIFNGVATWVPPESFECLDDNLFDPLNPCSVYNELEIENLGLTTEEFGGYILVTSPLGNQAGNAFRSEASSFDNFKLETVVELRDGSIGRPADGMVVVVVGGLNPPSRTGTGGGGMGAPCVGDTDIEPQLAFEFDNWSCNTGDNNNDNHVAFSYSPIGFPCTDAIPPDVKVDIPPSVADLHNQEPQPASPNRYKMTVFVQNCEGVATVAMDLEALDFNGGVDLGRVFTHVIENFEPFDGYLGVTASTGGAWQNHILHSATLTQLEEGFCLQPAATAERSFSGSRNPIDNCGDYLPGDEIEVTLTLRQVRELSDCCPAAGAITVTDTPPAGWEVVTPIPNGGTFDGTTVTWTVDNPQEGGTLSYTVVTEDIVGRAVPWGQGTVQENVPESPVTIVSGASLLAKDEPFDECGGFQCFNMLGAYMQLGGANPGEDAIRQDYLTDGVIGETEFVFEPGATINTDFFGASASEGLFDDPNGRNPGGVPTVFAFNEVNGGFIDLQNDAFGGTPDNVMAYAQTYVIAEEEQDVFLGVSSDDAVQVILNQQEVHINPVARAGADACAPQDPMIGPVTLLEGENSLILKVFEGGGDWNLAIRFEDDFGNPITEGISLTKLPQPGCRVPPVIVNRTIDAGETVLIGATPKKTWSEPDTEVDVLLDLSNVREAEGECGDPGTVIITETVPGDWTPSAPSSDGQIVGNQIVWTLDGQDLPNDLTYTVETGVTLGDVTFSGRVEEQGSDFRFGVKGERDVVFAPPALGQGEATVIIDDNFDEHTGIQECPDGWTCNGGFAGGLTPFSPGVTQDGEHTGRLRLAEDFIGTIGSTVYWNEPVELADRSLRAEFDVFFSATPGANPPADGLTFSLIDADDFLADPTALGGAGGQMGVPAIPGFAVELDLWNNGAQDGAGYNNPGYGHVAIIRDGTVTPQVQNNTDLDPDMIPTSFGGTGFPDFVDTVGAGVPLHVEVEYNNGRIQVFLEAPETANGLEPAFPRTKVLDTIVLFPTALDFGAEFPVLQRAFIGFTAGTGGAVAHHEVDNVLVTTFASDGAVEICDNDNVDDDGDGLADCQDPDCSTAPNCVGGDRFVRGDTDSSGGVNLTDGVITLNWLFTGGREPECLDAADADDTGTVNLTDAVFTFNWLFTGGGDPPPPTPSEGSYPPEDCGTDPTPDTGGEDLGCATPAEKCSG